MPLSLFCRRCSSQVDLSDSFCQECGLGQSSELPPTGFQPAGFQPAGFPPTGFPPTGSSALTNSFQPGGLAGGISDNDWPALAPDPLPPQRQAEPDQSPQITSLYGQTYKFPNYQLDLDSCSSENLQINEQAEDAAQDEDALKESAQKRLHSPIFEGKHKSNQNLGMGGGLFMQASDYLMIFSVLVFSLFLGIFGYQSLNRLEKQSKAKTEAEFSEKLKQAKSSLNSDYRNSYKKLLPFVETGKLATDSVEYAVFNEAAYRLGVIELEQDKPELAVGYFKHVTKSSGHYARVREFLLHYVSPVAVQVLPESRPAKQSSSRRLFILSRKPVLQIPALAELGTAEASGSAADANTSGEVLAEKNEAIRKFSESEISEYNKLLAAYFAKHTDKNREEAATEIPSFREWIKQDKPAF